MKTFVLTVGLMAGMGTGLLAQSYQAELPRQKDDLPVGVRKEAPNRSVGHKYNYSGVLVQLSRSKNPLDLINPWATAKHGPGTQNAARDIVSGKSDGINFFSIEF